VKKGPRGPCDKIDDVYVDGTSPMPITVQGIVRQCMEI
jgi:hypothetical protein